MGKFPPIIRTMPFWFGISFWAKWKKVYSHLIFFRFWDRNLIDFNHFWTSKLCHLSCKHTDSLLNNPKLILGFWEKTEKLNFIVEILSSQYATHTIFPFLCDSLKWPKSGLSVHLIGWGEVCLKSCNVRGLFHDLFCFMYPTYIQGGGQNYCLFGI